VVLLLDVLEHLDDEGAALETARRALAAGGTLVINCASLRLALERSRSCARPSAPLHGSAARRVVERAGFAVARVTYFGTLLFPAFALVRWLKRGRGVAAHDLRRPPAAINALLASCFAAERHLVPRLRLPVGSSLLLIAHR